MQIQTKHKAAPLSQRLADAATLLDMMGSGESRLSRADVRDIAIRLRLGAAEAMRLERTAASLEAVR